MHWPGAEDNDMKNFLSNALVIVLLVVGLGVWIALPWIGVAVLAVAITLWLLLTRTGRLALAATRIGLASLPQRWGASSVIVIGIAGVVGVLVAMMIGVFVGRGPLVVNQAASSAVLIATIMPINRSRGGFPCMR